MGDGGGVRRAPLKVHRERFVRTYSDLFEID
jgi:hypothetical protein